MLALHLAGVIFDLERSLDQLFDIDLILMGILLLRLRLLQAVYKLRQVHL